ncbi:MAG TPA: sigma 54-interacting transcriptional regulator [Candidatus Polarisedimenticolia bacterium]|nr:sigma 54-interacting transcriptional regulator [Candidatus Polarisedimenticolia bacterium]
MQSATTHQKAGRGTHHSRDDDPEARWAPVVLLGASPCMQRLRREIETAASTRCSVLIVGEAGTGKRRAAQELARLEGREDRSFVVVSCPSLPGEGAEEALAGAFRSADGGTLLLDEVGALAPGGQSALLRLLEGPAGRAPEPTAAQDVRLLASSTVDLAGPAAAGDFHPELRDRLAAVVIRIPPLRERRSDLPLLAGRLLETIGRKLGRPRVLSEKAVAMLAAHAWPGNVRELESVLEGAAILASRRTIGPSDLARCLPATEAGPPPETLEVVEKRHVEKVLQWTCGNKRRAAQVLGVPRSTLYRMLRRMDVHLGR